jgi:hypothetical protein
MAAARGKQSRPARSNQPTAQNCNFHKRTGLWRPCRTAGVRKGSEGGEVDATPTSPVVLHWHQSDRRSQLPQLTGSWNAWRS